MGAFDRALAFVLAREGGYVNDPRDPGGETKYGISRRAYPQLDIKGLTHADAGAIYARDYWTPAGCDQLPAALAIAVFDTAVNSGVRYAKGLLAETRDVSEYLVLRTKHYSELGGYDRFWHGWLRRVFALHTLCLKES